MRSILLLGIVSMFFMGCTGANGVNGLNGATGPAGPAASEPLTNDVTLVVDEANALRSAQGSESYVKGLSCSLYTVPTTTTQIVGATLTGVGSFGYLGTFNVANQSVSSGFNVLPLALQPVYQTWFIVKCSGVLINTDDAWHEFDVSSDDGSNLYVDGLLINNDGLHGVQSKANVKFLNRGVHSFELDFFQSSGSQALVVNEDSSLLDSTKLYH